MPAEATLRQLQVEQHKHDEIYHREIARLTMHHRLNHMALHFAKYAGKVAAHGASSPEADQAMVDTFIICLSTANVLNILLWDVVAGGGSASEDLKTLGVTLAGEHENGPDAWVRAMVIASGRMAAACEKIDHLEDISYRTEITAAVACLASLALAHLASRGDTPEETVRRRLAAVKARLKLHGDI